MARLCRETLEASGLGAEDRLDVLSRFGGNGPFFQLPAPPVPSPQNAGEPDGMEPVPAKFRQPRRANKPGHKR